MWKNASRVAQRPAGSRGSSGQRVMTVPGRGLPGRWNTIGPSRARNHSVIAKAALESSAFVNGSSATADNPSVRVDSGSGTEGVRMRSDARSAPARASAAGKRLLSTGDTTEQEIVEGLDAAGLLGHDGRTRVDVLHIPHYGSDLNASVELFRRVVADHYVITGTGWYNNPKLATLQMILYARCRESCTLDFVHRTGSGGLQARLDAFFAATMDRTHRRVFRQPDAPSLIVNLLQPVRY